MICVDILEDLHLDTIGETLQMANTTKGRIFIISQLRISSMKRLARLPIRKTHSHFAVHGTDEVVCFGPERLQWVDRVVNEQNRGHSYLCSRSYLPTRLGDLVSHMPPDSP